MVVGEGVGRRQERVLSVLRWQGWRGKVLRAVTPLPDNGAPALQLRDPASTATHTCWQSGLPPSLQLRISPADTGAWSQTLSRGSGLDQWHF